MPRSVRIILALVLVAPLAVAWDAQGHRTITYLALEGLPASMPAWLHEKRVHDRIAFQANEPDRWKGWPAAGVNHINRPDHYLDIELLDQFGLTLESLPRLRREYLRALAVSKHLHPEKVDAYDAGDDPDRIREWPGFALHAVSENYGKLQATFNEIRILEQINDPARAAQLEQARANAIFHMGVLSHFVADLAQPLHTTRHYNGWEGDNPNGYTTEHTIHSFVDGGMRQHGLTREAIRPLVHYDVELSAKDPWDDVLIYLRRSHALVEKVYQMERSGRLRKEPGKKLIAGRIADGAAMLSALYTAAYRSAKPTGEQIAAFVRYNHFKAEPEAAPAGASRAEE